MGGRVQRHPARTVRHCRGGPTRETSSGGHARAPEKVYGLVGVLDGLPPVNPISRSVTSSTKALQGEPMPKLWVDLGSAPMDQAPGWARDQAVETLNAALVETDGQKQAELLASLREVLVFNAPELLPEFVPRLLELQMYPVRHRPPLPHPPFVYPMGSAAVADPRPNMGLLVYAAPASGASTGLTRGSWHGRQLCHRAAPAAPQGALPS